MKKTVLVKEGIYAVGAVDWGVRNFHGYTTNRGSSYNAYLILDEKITLIDTVKKPFAAELLERISEIIDPAKIDYLVSNHVEMDHSGAIPEVMQAAPNATIVTTAPNGLKGLQAHYGTKYSYMGVKMGDSISLGKRTLTFVPTAMVHWPDNMVTYCPEEKILFSNDAFGQHYAASADFDDEADLSEVFQEAKKYYANILMPYGPQIEKAMQEIIKLDFDLIAPSHGVMWRDNIKAVVDCYQKWMKNGFDEEAVVVFDTMYHSTEKMAHVLAEVFMKAGKQVKLYDLKDTHISDIMTDILTAKYIAVGSPTLNNHILPTVAGFLSYLRGLAPKGRIGIAFGSYGWSGQSVGEIEASLKDTGLTMPFAPFRLNYIPQEKDLEDMANTVLETLL